MEKCLEMADVAECTIPECVYNRASRCYAKAITIGNGEHPECDTFYSSHNHSPRHELTAGVGACKVHACRFNDDYHCTAARIYVGYVGSEVACRTFNRS